MHSFSPPFLDQQVQLIDNNSYFRGSNLEKTDYLGYRQICHIRIVRFFWGLFRPCLAAGYPAHLAIVLPWWKLEVCRHLVTATWVLWHHVGKKRGRPMPKLNGRFVPLFTEMERLTNRAGAQTMVKSTFLLKQKQQWISFGSLMPFRVYGFRIFALVLCLESLLLCGGKFSNTLRVLMLVR